MTQIYRLAGPLRFITERNGWYACILNYSGYPLPGMRFFFFYACLGSKKLF